MPDVGIIVGNSSANRVSGAPIADRIEFKAFYGVLAFLYYEWVLM